MSLPDVMKHMTGLLEGMNVINSFGVNMYISTA